MFVLQMLLKDVGVESLDESTGERCNHIAAQRWDAALYEVALQMF